MKVVVLGCGGQLGWELCRHPMPDPVEVVALDYPEVDLAERSSVEQGLCAHDAGLVINAAAYTAVDQAEREPRTAFAVNALGPAYIADYCARKQIPLIHVSTDYVFDGTRSAPYRETDPVCPQSVYGKSKLSGEENIRKSLQMHVILRTAWLYGTHGKNFVKTILRSAGEQTSLRVVADQFGCPTYTAELAEAIRLLVKRFGSGEPMHWGTYHFCGAGQTSWYGFARKIVDSARIYVPLKVDEIVPLTTADYPTPAKRPAFSVLDCSRFQDRFGLAPRPWQAGLEAMLRDFLSDFDGNRQD